jgi:nucleotide-binding universal stress UspA family protein
LLGSVSSQIVAHVHCSVMVFQANQPSSPAHVASVVAGVDGSPGTKAAIAAGRRLAGALHAKLVLLSAHESPTALGPPTTELKTALRRGAAEVLEVAHSDAGTDLLVVEELREGDRLGGLP